MSVTRVFALHNNYTQSGQQGICTAASLDWCKKTLKAGRGLKAASELMDTHTLNAQMAVIRKLDASGADQTDRAGLKSVGGDRVIASIDDIIKTAKNTPPHVAIFWTSGHTMGYRYAHHEKEFFDIETGLFRAKLTDDLKKKMEGIIKTYGPVIGMRVVALQS
jgi:hypothetical protein